MLRTSAVVADELGASLLSADFLFQRASLWRAEFSL